MKRLKRLKRLNQAELVSLSDKVQQPAYDRTTLQPGIVHLGIGAFHRAHQAVYTDEVMSRQGGGNWGIVGCSLRSRVVSDQINPQDGLYSVVELAGDGEKIRVVGAIIKVLYAPEETAELVDLLASANIRIVSLTITEKGYCHDPASGTLQVDHPDIHHDLAHIDTPRSALGYLAAGLRERRARGGGELTLLSCDNLPANGKTLETALLQFVTLLDSTLAQWIRANVSFPCSMVDRIVPATTDENRCRLERSIGLRDEGMVVTEPFSQWVIEDNFVAGRPEWEVAGAELVNDVQAYEEMKLRNLNGSHSMLAYAGYLSGFEYIYQVMQQPLFVRLLQDFMAQEVSDTVEPPKGFDLERYQRQLVERFANSALLHKTHQIAMDGTQKIPQRWLNTVRDQLKRGGSVRLLCFALAAWIRYVSGVDEQGRPIAVSDPMAGRLRAVCDEYSNDSFMLAKAIVSIEEIFGTDLIQAEGFVGTIGAWLEEIYSKGTLNALADYFQ